MSFKSPSFFYRFLMIAFMNSVLYAEVSNTSIETKIIEKIAASLFPGQRITAWGETTDQKNMIKQSTKLNAVENSNDAQFIIVAKRIPQNFSNSSVLITTEYSLLKKEERIVGAFFWQKGRPNVLFLRGRMQKANLKLGHEFDKYIEDEL